ncbi:hypothetical protein RHGRI_024336 [Rhododendron griersonianum]|uniref:Uncharacterized protein n=1 Tax=Rhododendron griersonianum TaxID=479676 RepID=A0AAV6JBD2_9ERIC|nr:hypothetical protein RHGRI_024336 [Rhododendron griersonianum]
MGNHDGTDNDGNTSIRIELPVVELRECLGSSLEVVLITGLKKNFTISQVIGVIEDEGAEVVSASFSAVGDKVFHTLHAQAKVCRVGVDTAKGPRLFEKRNPRPELSASFSAVGDKVFHTLHAQVIDH